MQNDRAAKLTRANGIFNVDRQALIERQAMESAELKSAWKVRNERKAQAINALKAKGRLAKQEQTIRPPNVRSVEKIKSRRNEADILAKQKAKTEAERKLQSEGRLSPEEEGLLDQSEVVSAKKAFRKARRAKRTRSRKRSHDD